jgi:hypothetical protein
MREETRKRLERTLWRERLKKVALAGVGVIAIGLYFLFEEYDGRVENVRVPGTVASVGPLNTNSTKLVENGLSVGVDLDAGRRVTVLVLKKSEPHVGDHVQITEHRHLTGRTTYTWK